MVRPLLLYPLAAFLLLVGTTWFAWNAHTPHRNWLTVYELGGCP